jgi:hypothetical protein
MGVILADFAGNIFTQGKVNDIIVQSETKSSEIKIYGSNGDVIQPFGRANRVFTLEGFVTHKDGVLLLNGAMTYTGSIYYYSTVLDMVLIDSTEVYFQNLKWRDTGKSPMVREFSLTLVER